MNVSTKILILLGGIVVSTLLILSVGYFSWRAQADTFFSRFQHEKETLFKRVDDLYASELETMVLDYSWWDEMVALIESHDEAWGIDNLDPVMEEPFNVDAVWVYDVDGEVVYSLDQTTGERNVGLEFEAEELRQTLARKPYARFSIHRREGFFEVHTAPVHLGDEDREVATIYGYFLAARLWNDAYLKILSELTDCSLSVSSTDIGASVRFIESPDLLQGSAGFQRKYPGIDGKPIMTLVAEYRSPLLGEVFEFVIWQAIVLCGIIVFLNLLAGGLLYIWVVLPLRRLSACLKNQDTSAIDAEATLQSEIGQICRLIQSFFGQQRELREEIQLRHKTEDSLRQSENNLREAMRKMETMARDLHDGIIQSIYAVGLKLENGVETLGRNEKQGRSLVQEAKQQLNHVLRDIRNFLQGLEPEDLRGQDLGLALKNLIGNYEKTHRSRFLLKIDQNAVQNLSRMESLNLFYIAQELLSNCVITPPI